MKEKITRWIIVSIPLILVIFICLAIPADKLEGLRAERENEAKRKMVKIGDIFVFQREAVMLEWSRRTGTAVICILEDPMACLANKIDIKNKLEEYKRQYGFYPSEANWDAFLDDPRFWPPDSLAPRYCLSPANPYEYKSDTFPGSVPITNEHGTGYSKCKLRCIYDDSHKLETEDEKAN